MQHASEPNPLVRGKMVRTRYKIGGASLDALDAVQATTPDDVRGFGRPGRLRAQAGNDQMQVLLVQATG